jgi:hypothetical protein
MTDFYNTLETLLLKSTGTQRKDWALQIVEKDMDIIYLSQLLKCEPKIANRFLWMLSDVGLADKNKLQNVLPALLTFFDQLDPRYKLSFANYWLIAGVPLQDEGKAIDLLFQWIMSPQTNVTIKSRSLNVLFGLTQKYPDLRNELNICLEDLKNQHSKDFKKRVQKMLSKLKGN